MIIFTGKSGPLCWDGGAVWSIFLHNKTHPRHYTTMCLLVPYRLSERKQVGGKILSCMFMCLSVHLSACVSVHLSGWLTGSIDSFKAYYKHIDIKLCISSWKSNFNERKTDHYLLSNYNINDDDNLYLVNVAHEA